MDTTLKFPQDLVRFLYWIFFRPITLKRYISSLGMTGEDTPTLRSLCKIKPRNPLLRDLIALSLFHATVTPCLITLLMTFVLRLTGNSLDWDRIALGVSTICIITVGLVVEESLKKGIVIAIVGCIPIGMLSSTSPWVIGVLILGMAFSVLLGNLSTALLSVGILSVLFVYECYLLFRGVSSVSVTFFTIIFIIFQLLFWLRDLYPRVKTLWELLQPGAVEKDRIDG